MKIHVSPRCVQLCFPTALHCSKCPLLCGCSGAELTARWGISRKLSLRITQHTDCWLQQGISVETHIKYTSQFVTERAKILLQTACCARKSYSLQGISHSDLLIMWVIGFGCMQHKVISWSCKLIKSKVLHLTSETAQRHTSLDVPARYGNSSRKGNFSWAFGVMKIMTIIKKN